MKRKIRIRRVGAWNIGITLIVGFLLALISMAGEKKFQVLQSATEQYIACENAAKQLQDGSDYLTEQVRLYAMTGQREYMDLYFEEAEVTRRRETALESLKEYFDETSVFTALQSAMECSEKLMQTEYYSMRLTAQAQGEEESTWPESIQTTKLADEDEKLSKEEKLQKAQKIVCDDEYQDARTEITRNVTECMNGLIEQTRNSQGRAAAIFSDMYLKLEIGVGILVCLMMLMCLSVRKLIVKPLISYNESTQLGEFFPVIGAAELQNLAVTYNKVYQENEETQKLMRHEAEHDALTDLLNRGSFEKVLDIYENGESPFAMILLDVDTFKFVNDTYGHAMGDKILKEVASLLKRTFRSIDYICRIGGDEFAIVMVEMTSDLAYTIREKISNINQTLSKGEKEYPGVSLSVGVAFSDRKNPGKNIFKDADQALYYVKEHGKHGCSFYGEHTEKEN